MEDTLRQLDRIRSELDKLRVEMEQREPVTNALKEAVRYVNAAVAHLQDEEGEHPTITP